MPFQIIRENITKVTADAIVNTANPRPVIGRGTDSAIYEAAGKNQLLEERKKIGKINRGEAVSTPAFNLRAKYIIHTVGPTWIEGKSGERETLHNCYANSLSLAADLQCESIAFPLIASGNYGFPKDEALNIALEEIGKFLLNHEMDITLVVFDGQAFQLSKDLMGDIKEYIDEHSVSEVRSKEYADHRLLEEQSRRLEEQCRFEIEHLQRLDEHRRLLEEELRIDSERLMDEAKAAPQSDSSSGYESEDLLELEEKRTRLLEERRRIEQERSWQRERLEKLLDEQRRTEYGRLMDQTSAAQKAAPSSKNIFQSPQRLIDLQRKKQEEPRRTEIDRMYSASKAAPDEDFMPELSASPIYSMSMPSAAPSSRYIDPDFDANDLDNYLENKGDTFQQRLLKLIDERGLKDPDVYKKANIDRRVFSRIRCNPEYRLKKKTAVAFAIALELDMKATEELLSCAGFAISRGSIFDLIISYFISKRNYDINKINAVLFEYHQELLGY